MMNDIFSVLSSGAKFNKRKYGQDMNIVQDDAKKKRLQLKFLTGDTVNDFGEQPSNQQNPNDPPMIAVLEKGDEINAFRNRLLIRVKGDNIPAPASTFHDMKIPEDIKSIILHNIEESSWKEPTPIQMQAIPCLLEGRDLLAAAPTGSGKTAAFVIPVLSKLIRHMKQKTRAVILAPTKELAEQIHREVQRLSSGRKLKTCVLKKSITNNALVHQDKTALGQYDLVVSTPLRLLALVRANAFDLSQVETIVLDEVDKLFEVDGKDDPVEDENDGVGEGALKTRSSFLRQVDEILLHCSSPSLQRCLVSATTGPHVQELSASLLHDPVYISIGVENSGASTIRQRLMFVGREDGKLLAMRQLIQQGLSPPVLIFLQSKDRAKELFKELVYDGINVDVIHSERTAPQREEIIRRFRIGKIWVLICTDLMARGVDFKGVNMVINFDLPQSAVAYIHRIGRTGRAGHSGEAVTLFTEDDIPKMRPIANVMKLSGCEVPDWLLNIKQMSTKEKRTMRRHAPSRRSVNTSINRTKSNKPAVKETH